MQIRFDVDGGEWGICGHNLVDSHSMVESMVASLVARPTVVVHYRMQWNKPDSVVLLYGSPFNQRFIPSTGNGLTRLYKFTNWSSHLIETKKRE